MAQPVSSEAPDGGATPVIWVQAIKLHYVGAVSWLGNARDAICLATVKLRRNWPLLIFAPRCPRTDRAGSCGTRRLRQARRLLIAISSAGLLSPSEPHRRSPSSGMNVPGWYLPIAGSCRLWIV